MLDCGMHMGFNDDVRGIGAWHGTLIELAGGYSKISMGDAVWSIERLGFISCGLQPSK